MAPYLGIVVLLSVLAVGYCNQCSFTHNETYANGTTNGKTCLKFNATMALEVKYPNISGSSKKREVKFNCSDLVLDNDTVQCNRTTKKASFTYRFDGEDAVIVMFDITGSSKQWKISKVDVTVDSNDNSVFPNNTSPNGTYSYTNTKSDNIIGSVDNERSYYCESSRSLSLSANTTANANAKNFSVSLKISDFKVQAFKFKKTDTYGESARCSQDIKGSKIVPIAVGAALAGLVIIVLIAYIIGRLRSRKQSSYEALS